MTHLSLNMLIIMLNLNGLNTRINRQILRVDQKA